MRAAIIINPEAIQLAESNDPDAISWDAIEAAIDEARWNLQAQISGSKKIKPRKEFYDESDEVLCVTLEYEP